MINRILDTNVNRNNIILIGKNSEKFRSMDLYVKN